MPHILYRTERALITMPVARIIIIVAHLLSIDCDNEEPEIFVLRLVEAGCWKGVWEDSFSYSHILHVTLIKRLITVGEAVISLVTSLQNFVAKAIRSLGVVYKGPYGSRGSDS
jgi:hypothetical protein